MAEGVDGLLRDKTRPPGIAPLKTTLADKVVALTLEPHDHEATHWTVRAMAKAVGIAASSVVKIWHDHGLAPRRWRSFKLSRDPAFTEKLHDVVGLYVSPPAHAIVPSVDEKSQIQALETLIRHHSLDHSGLEFPGQGHGDGLGAPPGFMSVIGCLLQMAPCGRSSL